MSSIIPSSEQMSPPPSLDDDRLPKRFWDKIQVAEQGCWEWTASVGHHGYARYQLDGRAQHAHRVAYTTLVGDIPPGLVIDHLCRVRRCVNPAHLEPVTNAENLRRGVGMGNANGASLNGAKTHCPQGHPYDGDNLGVNGRGDRYCRSCKNAQSRACHARRRIAAKGGAR